MAKQPGDRHGLAFAEVCAIAEAQGMMCPITGFPFELDSANFKILDKDPHDKRNRSVVVDHDHKTNEIRGLLSDIGNLLLGQYDPSSKRFGRYGKVKPPQEVTDYLAENYVVKALGSQRFFK